ncbi:MAG: NFACT family protein [Clostridia bacterium]|nr:NFACT family protein [Clostridia bacterium]
MPQDAFTLNRICGELRERFGGGTVNRIVQSDPDVMIFTIFTGKSTRKLLISVKPDGARIGLTDGEEGLLTAPNFCMLLRKHLLSSVIKDFSIVGFDRIVKIDFETHTELSDVKTVTLYAELMGRYSNAILVENGKILGSNRGAFYDNGVRPLIAGRKYVLPPDNDKLPPYDERLVPFFDIKENLNAVSVAGKVAGLSNLTAEEIVNSFNGTGGKEFYKHLNDFVFAKNAEPNIVRENGKIKDFCAVSYAGISGEREYYPDLLTAEKTFFSEKEEGKKFTRIKDKLNSVINAAIKKTKKKLSGLYSTKKDAENAEENRIKGELLVANIYKLKRGDERLETVNYYDGKETIIPLDKTLLPSENAQAYFKKYNKQKRTLIMTEPRIDAVEKELSYLTSVSEEISLAAEIDELLLIKDELIAEGLITAENVGKKKRDAAETGRAYSYAGYTIRVGRNNAENDRLTFSARENDLWLHVKDYHSSHVIIESKKGTVSEKAIVFGAEICAYYSKAREGGKCEVVYTERRNVKKPPKSHPGFVTYADFKSVTVTPDSHADSVIKR